MQPLRVEIEVRVTDTGIHHATERSFYPWGGRVLLIRGSASSMPWHAQMVAKRRFRALRRDGLAVSWN
jgi:hypothetical protein